MKKQTTIGQKIAAARVASGLNQSELAAAVDATQASVSRWESGAIDPPASALERVATATGRRLELVKE